MPVAIDAVNKCSILSDITIAKYKTGNALKNSSVIGVTSTVISCLLIPSSLASRPLTSEANTETKIPISTKTTGNLDFFSIINAIINRGIEIETNKT